MSSDSINVLEVVGVDTQIEIADKSAVSKCTKYVDFTALYRSDNVRGKRDEQLPQIVASLRKNGFKPNHPLVVSKKVDGRFLVLCGNRRMMGLESISAEFAGEFGRVLPRGKVPCIVHEGLTVEEEIIIRIDHSEDEDRVSLTDWSLFLAVKQLVRAGMGESEKRIAEKLGLFNKKGKKTGEPNRSIIQPRVNLARLPGYVQDEYCKLWDNVDGKAQTSVRVEHIKDLYKAYNAEYAVFPDGDGPALRAAFDAIIAPAGDDESADSNEESDAKALSIEAARTRGMGCASSLVKRILLAVTNQGGILAELDAQAVTLETDSQVLSDIRTMLGQEDFDDLAVRAREYRLEQQIAQSAQPEVVPF